MGCCCCPFAVDDEIVDDVPELQERYEGPRNRLKEGRVRRASLNLADLSPSGYSNPLLGLAFSDNVRRASLVEMPSYEGLESGLPRLRGLSACPPLVFWNASTTVHEAGATFK